MTARQWPAGIKRTRQREGVLRILEKEDAPLTALEIFNRLQRDGEAVSLSTVYRNLEMLNSKELVIKTTVMDSDMAFYELSHPTHKHYAVCIDCHKLVAINNCPMAEFTPKIADSDFRVLGHKIEMYGICKDCGKRNKNH